MSDLRIRPEDEMMVVEAARMLTDHMLCFVGIGLPSAAALIAQRTHAPKLYLVYESGTLGPSPGAIPFSVADDQLALTAESIVSVPEIFNYWLQPGRIDLGLLGTAQIDRFANLNSTVVGEYEHPSVRLPGAGGAPEIVASCKAVVVMVRQSRQTFVDRVDFVTSFGHGTGSDERHRFGFAGKGPIAVVTDLGVYEFDAERRELILTMLHPGVTEDQAKAATGWELVVAEDLRRTKPPSEIELTTIHRLNGRMPG